MLYIHGIGHFHPDEVIDNAFLEELGVGLSDEWILERVGIEQRRTSLPLDYIRDTYNQDTTRSQSVASHSMVTMSCQAALLACARAGIDPQEIGMVISDPGGGLEYRTPCVANQVAAELGVQGPAFDLGTACATFGLHLHALSSWDEAQLPTYVLSVICTPVTWITNYRDPKTAPLFGDAAVATVLSKRKPGRIEVQQTSLDSDSSQWHKIQAPSDGHFTLDGKAVQKFAIRKTIDMVRSVHPDPEGGWGGRYFIAHPANTFMLDAICRNLEIPDELHLRNVAKFGNCGQTSAPSVFSQEWDRFAEGDEILFGVVGGGLTWAGIRMQCMFS